MLFRRKHPTQPVQSEADVYLSSEVRAKGTIQTSADVHIDGQFSGTIKSAGLVEIGKNAKAKADITARAVIVDGFLQGKVSASEEIAVHNSAEVQAQLESATLLVEKNALIDGSVKVAR